MKSDSILRVFLLFLCFVAQHSPAQEPGYKNPQLPVEQRVADLLSRMTLEEKVAQLRSMIGSRPRLTAEVLADQGKMESFFKDGLGMMNPDFDATMEETLQRRN